MRQTLWSQWWHSLDAVWGKGYVQTAGEHCLNADGSVFHFWQIVVVDLSKLVEKQPHNVQKPILPHPVNFSLLGDG